MPRDGDAPLKELRSVVLPPIRVSEAERSAIQQQAKSAGLSVSAYGRQAMLNAEIKIVVSSSDPDAIRQLAAIGNNMNQLTHMAHILDDYDRRRLHEVLDQIAAWIDKAI